MQCATRELVQVSRAAVQHRGKGRHGQSIEHGLRWLRPCRVNHHQENVRNLQERIDLAREYGFAVQRPPSHAKDQRADADHHITPDDCHRQEARHLPQPGQNQEYRYQQQFVCQRVEKFPEAAGPGEMLGQPAVQPIADRRDAEQQQRAFISASDEPVENRPNQRNPGEADDVGQMAHGFGYYNAPNYRARMNDKRSYSYRDAGVDIDAGDALVERIKPLVKRTQRPEVLAGIGGFGALVEVPAGYRRPVLVSGTDGVGTKLRLAIDTGHHSTIGIDLVAMCANDVVVQGAEPLFFLDYYATGRLDVEVATSVISGIAEGCAQAGAALVGGETAEMPGMYHGADYDLAGFCVGVVERDSIIDGTRVRVGDAVIGLASSGPHSNGYSLIRKLIEVAGATLDTELEGRALFERLLTPTRIYVRALLKILRAAPLHGAVHGLAHITGGGLTDNIPRVLPDECEVQLSRRAWPRDPVFEWLARTGNVSEAEMHRTFNCGIGMVVIVAAPQAQAALSALREAGETAHLIGEVRRGGGGVIINP